MISIFLNSSDVRAEMFPTKKDLFYALSETCFSFLFFEKLEYISIEKKKKETIQIAHMRCVIYARI